MKNFVWILLLALQFSTSSQDMIGWWNVDCGSNVFHVGPNSISWTTDEGFIKLGSNGKVSVSKRPPLEEMNTVRSFPNRRAQNCYILPTYAQTLRYLIRAGFFYGDYDGYSKPPTFDLYIDDKKWSTVNTSTIEGPIYIEALHVTHGSGSITVCLRQTNDGETPFISSLEAVPLWVNLYEKMEKNVTFALVNRSNFGGNEVRFAGYFSAEKYNRIWTQAATPSNCTSVLTLPDSTAIPDNEPPDSVLRSSIVSPNLSTPITLFVDLPPSQLMQQTAYFVFYFTELMEGPASSDKRIIDIYINGGKMDAVVAEVKKCKVVTLYPVTVVGPRINISLTSASSSTLPPMISAMEVFTMIDHGPAHGDINTSGALDHSNSVYSFLIQVILLINAVTNNIFR